jgi:2-phosphosulfolactate phosphatase
VDTDQAPFAIRFEWGERGLAAIARRDDLIVIVDVLSFSTCVDVATARGASILPYRWKDQSAADFARRQNAELAQSRTLNAGYSLSPTSLESIPAETRLVLPSPNGAKLSLAAAAIGTVVAGCLRNAVAVARFAQARRKNVAVIGCGERWEQDDSLRPAWEDLVGAGAVIAELTGLCSPEAMAARDAFLAARIDLLAGLSACSSGRELIERGFAHDVDLAAHYAVGQCVPLLVDGAFTAVPTN